MKLTTTKVRLHSMRIYAYHGVLPQEAAVGGWYTVSVSMHLRTTEEKLLADDLDQTVNYASAHAIVRRRMAEPSRLIETVAADIARLLLNEFHLIYKVKVSVCKDTPPMPGITAGASCTVKAKRD